MRDSSLRSGNCLRPPLVNAVSCLHNTMCFHAIPRRERDEVQAELKGIWEQPAKPEALTQVAASTRQVCSALSGKRCEAWRRMKSTS
jgi:hypothetical protein